MNETIFNFSFQLNKSIKSIFSFLKKRRAIAKKISKIFPIFQRSYIGVALKCRCKNENFSKSHLRLFYAFSCEKSRHFETKARIRLTFIKETTNTQFTILLRKIIIDHARVSLAVLCRTTFPGVSLHHCHGLRNI